MAVSGQQLPEQVWKRNLRPESSLSDFRPGPQHDSKDTKPEAPSYIAPELLAHKTCEINIHCLNNYRGPKWAS